MKKLRKIAGVTCRIEEDEDFPSLYNIFIEGEPIPEGISEKEFRRRVHEGEILMPEWIVRGQGPEEDAIETAAKVIAVRRTGRQVTHHYDPEGRIGVIDIKVPFEELEKLREDFERRRNQEEGDDE
jgi:hypothetical protein